MTKRFVPFGNRIVVKVLTKEVEEGKLHIVRLKTGVSTLEGKVVNSSVEAGTPAGTVVLYKEYDGTEVDINGETFTVLSLDEVIGAFYE